MKKMITGAIIAVLSSVAALASFGVKGIYFSPSDKDFKDIYGGGMMYGGEFSFRIAKSLDLWIGGSYFSKKGNLTYTRDETNLTLIPLGGGLRYRFMSGRKISPYVAAGPEYFLYKESNVLGDVNSGGIGFIGKAGVLIGLAGSFGLEVHAGYSWCKFKPADFEINVGGVEFGAGIFF